MQKGSTGETFNIGGNSEVENIAVVKAICKVLDEALKPGHSCRELITFVKDRPGHDWRYAIDFSSSTKELGWMPAESFATGLEKTVRWYLANTEWTSSREERRIS